MKPIGRVFVLWTLLCVLAPAQNAPNPVYAVSFRKGSTKVAEATLHAVVDDKNPNYRVKVKDSAGNEHFEFSLSPIRVDGSTKSILSWQAGLEDVHRRVFGNLLLPNRDVFLNENPAGKAAELNPNPYAVVPFLTKRVIKVEDFYCVLLVTRSHRRTPDNWQLDSMEVDVQFTNSNPLKAESH
ncbi:MAG TPA: hypothetical protein VH437_04795 [Terriglobales bacterium]